MNIIDVVYRSVWKARTTHEATYEKDAGQVRGDERVHSARSTNEHRVAVKYRRRHWPWHVHSDMNRATEQWAYIIKVIGCTVLAAAGWDSSLSSI